MQTKKELCAVADARAALQKTPDESLLTRWKLLAAGNAVSDTPRHIVIRETERRESNLTSSA